MQRWPVFINLRLIFPHLLLDLFYKTTVIFFQLIDFYQTVINTFGPQKQEML